MLHSGRSRTPLWVAERLTRAQLHDASDETRTNQFYEEARLPADERAKLQDYKGSGFDRGHMAAAANMPTPSAMAQSFSLANMVPQAPKNNRGIWAEMEQATRALARKRGTVHVVSGPLFIGKALSQLNARVLVPSHLYKAVLDPARNEAFVWVIENTDEAVPRTVSVAEFQKFAGIALFPGRQPGLGVAPPVEERSSKRR